MLIKSLLEQLRLHALDPVMTDGGTELPIERLPFWVLLAMGRNVIFLQAALFTRDDPYKVLRPT